MTSPALTRRALIAGAGTSIVSAALAVPYVNAARAEDLCSLPAKPETITDRLDRLTSELSLAMAEYQGGKFKIVVEPGLDGDVTFVRMEIPALERQAYHLAKFKSASEELDPLIQHWSDRASKGNTGPGTSSYRFTGEYTGDGLYETGYENALGRRTTWHVTLRHGEVIDGERIFRVECPGDRRDVIESNLRAFIGRKLSGIA